ncbi:MAG: GNAT family N-acetyltransferase [Clostridiales bacterium]|nr:GNAT family N-acetyltransferase [Clostridiales bacterium]
MIKIKETTEDNLREVQLLWADGDVMRFVGFPDGLHESDKEMQNWIKWIETNRPAINHFCIFEDGVFCGETFYQIDREHGSSAAVDIKLYKFARGRGIATKALSYAIDQAFGNGAEKVWVDPNPENEKAIALYERLGFERKPMPAYLISEEEEEPISVYMELSK